MAKIAKERLVYNTISPKTWILIFQNVMQLYPRGIGNMSLDIIVCCTLNQIKKLYPDIKMSVPINYVRWLTTNYKSPRMQAKMIRIIKRYRHFFCVCTFLFVRCAKLNSDDWDAHVFDNATNRKRKKQKRLPK